MMLGRAPRCRSVRWPETERTVAHLIAGYATCSSDIKALIAVLFVAIMMLTVVQYRERYPWYLSVPVILTPFMII